MSQSSKPGKAATAGRRIPLRTRAFSLAVMALLPMLLGGCGAAYVVGAILIFQDDDDDDIDLTQVDLFPVAAQSPTTVSAAGTGDTVVVPIGNAETVAPALTVDNPNEQVNQLVFPIRTRGVSISGASGATDLTVGAPGTSLMVSINGEAAQTIQVNPFDPTRPLNTPDRIAVALERAIRGLTAANPANQIAYDNLTAVYDEDAERYILRTGFGLDGDSGPTGAGFTIAITGGPAGDDLAAALLLGQGQADSDEFSEFADIAFRLVNRGDRAVDGGSVKVYLSRDKVLDTNVDLLVRDYTISAGIGEAITVGPLRASSAQSFITMEVNQLPDPLPISAFVTNDTPARLDPLFNLIIFADVTDANTTDNALVAPQPVEVFPITSGGVGGPDILLRSANTQTAALAAGLASVDFTLQNAIAPIAADTPVGVTFYLSRDRILDLPLDPFNPERDGSPGMVAEDIPLATFLLQGSISPIGGTGGLQFDLTLADPTVQAADVIGRQLVVRPEARTAGTREGSTIVAFDDSSGNPFRVTIGTPFTNPVVAGEVAQVLSFESTHIFQLNSLPGGGTFARIGDRQTFNRPFFVPSLTPNLLPQENDSTDLNTFFVIGRITTPGVVGNDPNNDVYTAINYLRVYPENQVVLLGGNPFPQTVLGDPTQIEAVNNQQAAANIIGKGQQRLLSFDIPTAFSQLFVSCESADFDPKFEILSSTGARFGFADDTDLGQTSVSFQPLQAPVGQRTFLLVVSPADPASADVNAQGSAFNILISANPNANVQPTVLGEALGIQQTAGSDDSFIVNDAVGNPFRISRKTIPVSLPQLQRQFLFFLTEDQTLLSMRLRPDFPEAVSIVLTANFANTGQIQTITPVPVFQPNGDVLLLFDPPNLNQFKSFGRGSVIITLQSQVPVNTPSDLIVDLVYQPR